MQTQRVDITPSAWTEIAEGSEIILVEGGTADAFLLHFTNTPSAPADDAPAHRVQTFPAALDFTQYNLVAGQRVWVKSTRSNSFLVVSRNVQVFVLFIPLGSDSLITADDLTFNSQES